MEVYGGNAIDAAIATSLCSSALHTQSTGVGGGMFAVIYHKEHGMTAIDARESAPMAASKEMFNKPGFKHKTEGGGLSICVPGILKGYLEMHSRFGTLPWRTLLEPTIKLLRDGFPLTSATYIGLLIKMAPAMDGLKGFDMFLDETNRIKPRGSIIRLPKLARTLERIAEDPHSFYSGSLAQDIVEDVKEAGGILTEEDLSQYRALIKKPTELDLPGDLTLYSVPSPAAGPTLSYILSILSGYEMTPDDFKSDEAKIRTYHRIIEALKFANARKTRLGDEDFVDIESLTAKLTSRSYGDITRSLIDDSKTQELSYYGPIFHDSRKHGTSHLSIIDREGNAVALSSSLNFHFGSRVIGNRTGIFFNNQMNDFSHPFLTKFNGLHPAEANFIEPGKRSLSAMCPTIIWDKVKNKVAIVTGAAGGLKIQATLAMTIMNVLWFNMSIPESIDQPRMHHEFLPNDVVAEGTFPPHIKAGLEDKGHTFLLPPGISVVQMIQVLDDAIVAACDFRKGGEPSGF